MTAWVGESHGLIGLPVTHQWTCRRNSPHAAASLIYIPAFCCHSGMKEVKQDAAVPCGLCQADRSTITIMIT